MHNQLIREIEVEMRKLPPGQELSNLCSLARMSIDLVRWSQKTDQIRQAVSDKIFNDSFQVYREMWLLATYIERSVNLGRAPFQNPPEHIQKILEKGLKNNYHDAYGGGDVDDTDDEELEEK